MKWLVALPTVGGGQLRAALSNVGVTQIYFEWVNDAKDPVLGGAQALTLCADEMLVTTGLASRVSSPTL